MGHYLAGQVAGLCIGFVVGAFTPAVGRKLKGLFVKETQNVEQKIGGLGADIRKHL